MLPLRWGCREGERFEEDGEGWRCAGWLLLDVMALRAWLGPIPISAAMLESSWPGAGEGVGDDAMGVEDACLGTSRGSRSTATGSDC